MNYLDLLREQFNNHIRFRERRPGIEQLLVPLFHEDGDMVDIFLDTTNNGNMIRVCDLGMTFMRLSYSVDTDTPSREKIISRILEENRISESNGNLFIESPIESLYPAILQLAQVIGKISSMRYYRREIVRSMFYEELGEFIQSTLSQFTPKPSQYPINDRDDLEVDWLFELKTKPVYLFGVRDSAKARISTIGCLEFLRKGIPFRSFIVHEDFDNLARKDRIRLTSAADKQFPSLDDFRENAHKTLEREVA